MEKSFGFWKRCFACEDIADGSVPMADCSPRSDRPDFIFTGHPGTKLPRAELTPYLSKTSNNLVHCRALCWVFLDHVDDERFDESEIMILLIHTIQKGRPCQ